MGSANTKEANRTSKKRKAKVKYKVTVRTNNVVYGGTDGTVQIKIIGDTTSTNLYTLNNWYDGFEKDKDVNVFTVTDIDIGNIRYIFLRLGKSNEEATPNYWFIEDIEVVRQGSKEPVRFPVYEWLVENNEKDIFLCTNYTSIPQYDFEVEGNECQDRRSKQTKKDIVQWSHSRQGFPGHLSVQNYDSLDLNLKTKSERDTILRYTDSSEILHPFLSIFKSFECLDDFLLPAQCISDELKTTPWVHNDKWKKDEEFGRQLLNGLNPGNIVRCSKIPDNLPLDNTHVQGLLVRGMSLEEELKLGNIYMVNHDILSNVSSGTHQGKDIQLPAPICVLHLKTDGELVPIAIQLGQEAGPDCPIWTPKDEPLDWLLAKMWFKNADLQVHQIKCHYAFTHAFAEMFAIAMYRCLPPIHPIYKLLKEHLRNVIAVNTWSRQSLFSLVSY